MLNPNDDNLMPEGWIDRTEPWELLEFEHKPADLIRDARVQAMAILNAFGSWLERTLSRPGSTLRDVKVKFYGISGALGLNLMDGRTFTELSETLGVERATLSKVAREFCMANNLEPSFMMKCSASAVTYANRRIESIQRNGSNGNGSLPHPPDKGRGV